MTIPAPRTISADRRRTLYFSAQRHFLTVSDDLHTTFSFDREGRLLGLLNKPGSLAACVEAVQTIKSAGINVGVILRAGAGGARLAAAHVTHSLDALAAMNIFSLLKEPLDRNRQRRRL